MFLTILKGEYDSLLQWPFACPITFMMLDQSSEEKKENGGGAAIVHLFKPFLLQPSPN